MKDTIELLEAIGCDASLRHAPTDELVGVLERAGASTALSAAVATGDSARLADEFGHLLMHMPQISQVPGCEDDEVEEQVPHDDGPDDREAPSQDV
ncbi:hypothetical protein QFZ41_000088 [Luteibacter sp. W1I16]|uniref:hypothetical protein n=1 Tax=Luteibacter sp. W1I16 TaxID=3373922 RepID=UPI003D1D1503